jgi:adenylate kinase
MAKGLLVDDATMLELIRDRVSQSDAANGFILDGFPRTQAQAEGLTALMGELDTPIDAVVLFDVGDEELVRRISGRRTCSLCNKVFNIFTAPPSSPAADCVDGSSEHQLFQRKDDEEATVKERLRVYEEKTRPVLSYYSNQGALRTVRAEGSLEDITARLLGALEDARNGQNDEKPAAKPVRKPAARKRAAARRVTKPTVASRTRKTVRRAVKRPAAKRAAAKRVLPKKKRAPVRKSARKVTRPAKRVARPARSRRKK